MNSTKIYTKFIIKNISSLDSNDDLEAFLTNDQKQYWWLTMVPDNQIPLNNIERYRKTWQRYEYTDNCFTQEHIQDMNISQLAFTYNLTYKNWDETHDRACGCYSQFKNEENP